MKSFVSRIDKVLKTNLLIWPTNTAKDANVFLTDDDIVIARKNGTTKIFQSGKVYVIESGKSFANEFILGCTFVRMIKSTSRLKVTSAYNLKKAVYSSKKHETTCNFFATVQLNTINNSSEG